MTATTTSPKATDDRTVARLALELMVSSLVRGWDPPNSMTLLNLARPAQGVKGPSEAAAGLRPIHHRGGCRRYSEPMSDLSLLVYERNRLAREEQAALHAYAEAMAVASPVPTWSRQAVPRERVEQLHLRVQTTRAARIAFERRHAALLAGCVPASADAG